MEIYLANVIAGILLLRLSNDERANSILTSNHLDIHNILLFS